MISCHATQGRGNDRQPAQQVFVQFERSQGVSKCADPVRNDQGGQSVHQRGQLVVGDIAGKLHIRQLRKLRECSDLRTRQHEAPVGALAGKLFQQGLVKALIQQTVEAHPRPLQVGKPGERWRQGVSIKIQIHAMREQFDMGMAPCKSGLQHRRGRQHQICACNQFFFHAADGVMGQPWPL